MKIYPKLNIFLNVLPLAPDSCMSCGAWERGEGDGAELHSILSRFVLARGTLYDEMELRFGSGGGFELLGDFDCDLEQNLIFRAKEELKARLPHLGKELDRIRVEVQKSIPTGAGLGGGSADAAAFLLELGREFALDDALLMEVAMRLGSDVGFFISEYESANVRGVGDVVEEFVEATHYDYEIFTPDFACETGRVYTAFDELGYSSGVRLDFLNLSSMELLHRYEPEELNDLFLPACKVYPKLLGVARELGRGWFFSGSGSSFFRIRS